MDITIIIVNYNVRYFLEQCLHSVYKALGDLKGEIIVVDNNSVDGSCQMLKEKFPAVILIENKKNTGFSKANNQGINIATGKYVLLLNPDTVVQEDTFIKCFNFMEEHLNAGCLGVKMIDGSGNYLPESKRALPTPRVSFYKIFGLSALFPKSKQFGRYHLGYLDNSKTHSIEILPGAFMFIRKSVLDIVGLLDETFFMYGEDIDLSYRIKLAGFENYYYPETTIIHYKGESTKKGSINYVMVFYKAMIIFARKHFSPEYAKLYSVLINVAVYLRASFSILRRILLSVIIPLADAFLIYAGYQFIKPIWENYKFGGVSFYPNEYMLYMVPAYIGILLVVLYGAGGYEKRSRPIDLLRGIAIGGICLLLVYSLLPEHLRYSRALILAGTLWAGIVFFTNRLILGSIFKTIQIDLGKRIKRIVIVGSQQESERVMSILKQVNIEPVLVGLVNWESESKSQEFMGNLGQISEIVKINRIDEIVFCALNIPSGLIIKTMLNMGDESVEFKIAPPESLSVIGSNSINTAGELYVVNFSNLGLSVSRRKKRVFDFIAAFMLLALYPICLFFIKRPLNGLINIFAIIFGIKTWVGYFYGSTIADASLPHLKNGVLSPISKKENRNLSKETIERVNLIYAKDYKIMNDLSIIIRDFRFLGN